MFSVFSAARKPAARLIAVLSLFWLAACDVTAPGAPLATGRPVDPDRPVPVALLVPRSSEGASGVARSLEAAARLAVADLSGVTIDLRVYDTAGSSARAAQVAQQAADEGAAVILGPLFGDAANAAAVAVADDGVTVLSFSNNTSIAGGNLFVLGPTFENTAERLARYASRQGKRSLVTVHPANVEGQFGRNAIRSAAVSNGIAVAGEVSFPFTEQGAISAASQVAQTVRANDADAVFLTSNSAGALPLLAQLIPERGIDPEVTQYIGLARWDVPPQTLELPGLEGGWFARPDEALQAQFRARYQAANGEAPHPLAGLAYDGIAAIGALARSGSRDALSPQSFTRSRGFAGTGGAFRLRPDGTNERALAVATIRDRQVVILDPAPRSFAGAGS
ncbi:MULTISPECIES: penicillin-binding protein activator [unclassified Rhodosalinus]|uniref:penicillin-binding protein activator n=1 Tax=unclassified Rhodosalinus TaxID=2630183 RepID=UPI0035258F08